MKLVSLFALVVVQVVCFQFLMLKVTRVLPERIVGSVGLPGALSAELARFRAGAGRLRRALGALLIAAAVVAAFAPIALDPGHRKLALAAVSLASSLLMILAWLRDTRTLLRLRESLPEPRLRIASLLPNDLRYCYPPAWELMPAGLAALILALSVTAGLRAPAGHGPSLLPVPVVLVLFVLAGFLLAHWLAAHPPLTSQKSLAHQGDPGQALAQARALRRGDLRAFLAFRVGAVLLLGLIQLQIHLKSAGREIPLWVDMADRALPILLLLAFGWQLLDRRGAGARR